MISVCIATYNGALYIKEQLESILSQLSDDDEIIVSDDGSSDSTIDVISMFNDPRISVLHHKHQFVSHNDTSHIKVTRNFENAIKYAKGDIIFLSDQDDRWLPGRVKAFLKALESSDIAMCNFNLMNKDGIKTKLDYFSRKPVSSSFLINILRMPFYGSAIAFKKSLLKHILPFPKYLPVHDNWIGFIGSKYGEFKYISQALHDYRRHNENVSHSIANKNRNSIFYKIKYRLLFLYWYIIR